MVAFTPINDAEAPKLTGKRAPLNEPSPMPSQVLELFQSQSAGFQLPLADAAPIYPPVIAKNMLKTISVIASSPSGSMTDIGELPIVL